MQNKPSAEVFPLPNPNLTPTQLIMNWTLESNVLIQGITEPLAADYVRRMKAVGTRIVAGVSVGCGGQTLEDIPLFDLVETARANIKDISISLIFVPPLQVLDAALEAIAAKIKQIIIITPLVPPLDMVKLLQKAEDSNTFILGSGSQGVIIPEKLWLGIGEFPLYTAGNIGLISRCDRLIDETAHQLTQAGLGQSLAISLGTDGIVGSNFEQWLQLMEEDDATEAIVLIGQGKGIEEQQAAAYIESAIEKPVIAYLVGLNADFYYRFGDAATIIANQLSHITPSANDHRKTLEAFKNAKVTLATSPTEIPKLLKKVLKTTSK